MQRTGHRAATPPRVRHMITLPPAISRRLVLMANLFYDRSRSRVVAEALTAYLASRPVRDRRADAQRKARLAIVAGAAAMQRAARLRATRLERTRHAVAAREGANNTPAPGSERVVLRPGRT
jgi:hypothetical protein